MARTIEMNALRRWGFPAFALFMLVLPALPVR